MKKNNKKGFTLAELLIVVAIIGILVAISIPVFTAQLKKAKDATNVANARSIYAQLTADYLDDGKIDDVPDHYGWDENSDYDDIIIGTEKYHFAKLPGAELTITNATGSDTAQPTVTYKHGDDLGFDPQTSYWGDPNSAGEDIGG